MAKKEKTYTIAGIGWPADPALGLREDEAYRATHYLGVINKPALVGWAGKQEGLAYEAAMRQVGIAEELVEATRAAKGKVKAAEKKMNEAGDIGTAAHEWIAWWNDCQHINGGGVVSGGGVAEPIANEAIRPAVEIIKAAWLKWVEKHEWSPTFVEQQVWSREDRWSGTLDLAGDVDGRLEVIDIKSSTGIWDEQLLQLSAYCAGLRLGLAETAVYKDQGPIPGRILRLPKTAEALQVLVGETGQPYEERIIEDPAPYYAAFLAAKGLFEVLERLKARE